MSAPAAAMQRHQTFLRAAAFAYDESPHTPEKLGVLAAVEALIRAAYAQPQVTRAIVEELVVAVVGDPWSSTSARLAYEVLSTIPEAEWKAALISAGLADSEGPVPLHPLFVAAGEALGRIHDEQGPEAVNAAENTHLIAQMLQYAPDRQQGIADYFRDEYARARVLH